VAVTHNTPALGWLVFMVYFITSFCHKVFFELPNGCSDGQSGGGSFGDGSPHNINCKAWLG
jgi:hypothetical protein